MKPKSKSGGATRTRARLKHAVGKSISRLQDSSVAFDDLAAEILAVDRTDLPCMTRLLFEGPASADELAAGLGARRGIVVTTVDRLQLAGYARFQPGSGDRLELTEHARKWIERIWAPLRKEGYRLLDTYPTQHLRLAENLLRRASEVQEAHTRKLRHWIDLPASPARRTHLRGGLSPAALRRVQVFVEANLARAIHINDMAARAALSPYHFARAFKRSAGMTPRAFIEQRRIERAKSLLTASTRALAEIAGDTGFNTQSRLTTTFKRRTGFTPAVYRRGLASRRAQDAAARG